MKWKHRPLIALLSLLFLMPGCARITLHAAGDMIPNLTGAFFEECDVDLAREALPAELKLMEGLLKSAPRNQQLLTALCMGFTGYAMLFVEEASVERASMLYLRARSYGMRALGVEGVTPQDIDEKLTVLQRASIEPLFWTTLAWNAWIGLNIDNPAALGELSMAQKCLKRVMEMDPEFFYGSPYVVYGSMLAARPKILGGDADRAKVFFERAMALTQGKFFLAPYFYAKTYAVRVQNKALFLQLIESVETTPSDAIKDACLMNRVMKERMKILKAEADDLFF